MTKTDSAGVSVLPWPRQVDVGSGSLRLSRAVLETSYLKTASPRIAAAVQRFLREVTQLTGIDARETEHRVAQVDASSTTIALRINCESAGAEFPDLDEDESYWLVVDDAGIYIDAACDRGVLHALTTLTQLVGPDGGMPYVAIDDVPRLPWRGLLLDVARHFLDTDSLSRTLNGMALCKLNVLHLHLSDDQAFRLPSLAFPKLTSEPAFTREQLRALVREAALLGIRVVPEIDMPGHVTCWLTAYPEWGSRPAKASRRFGGHPACLDPSNEAVYTAIGQLLDEICEIFPDSCLHLGGDEVHPEWWTNDPAVSDFMQANGIEDVAGLQAYFNQRVGALVAARGRTVVAWDEVLHPELDKDWIVQCWRGATQRDRSRANGNRTLISAHYYLDLNYPVDVHYRFDPLAAQQVLLEQEDELLDDPRFLSVAGGLRREAQWREGAIELAAPIANSTTNATTNANATMREARLGDVIGGEACLWGELVDTQVLDVRLWSRLPAVAERFWSAASCQDLTDFYGRLARYLKQIHPLRGYAIAERSHQQLVPLGIGEQWLPLVDMLEPLKWYARLLGEQALMARTAGVTRTEGASRVSGKEVPQARPYDADTPLTGVADYLPPESLFARQVDALCTAHARGDEQSATELEKLARLWIGLESATAPVPLEAMAKACGKLGHLVLQRLHGPPQEDWAQELLDITTPRGELQLAVGTELRRWLAGGAD